jgi:hypothetical protein
LHQHDQKAHSSDRAGTLLPCASGYAPLYSTSPRFQIGLPRNAPHRDGGFNAAVHALSP